MTPSAQIISKQPIGQRSPKGRIMSGTLAALIAAFSAACGTGEATTASPGSGGMTGTPAGSATGGAAPGSGGAVGSGGAPAGSGGSSSGGSGTGGRAAPGSGGGAAGGTTGVGGRARNGGNGVPTGTGGAVSGAGGGTGTVGLGGASLCVTGQYAICESFEGTAVGAIPTGWTAHGAATVAMDQAARGTHSLKVSPAAKGERRIYTSATKLGSGHWGRIFYKLQAPVPVSCDTNTVLHSTFVGLHGVGPKNGAEEVRVVDTVENLSGMHQWIYNLQTDGAGEFGKGSPYNYKFDGNWHCAEWHVDNPTQNYHLFIDGAEIPGVAINNGANNFTTTDVPPVFDQVRVGIYNYQSACAPFLTVWIDEIAMDPMRIGCGN